MLHTPDSDIDLRSRHPDFQRFLDHNECESQRVREHYRCALDVPYGPEALQRVDLFMGENIYAATLAFIHGGYWRALDKRSYSFVAEPFVNAGYSVAVLNYRLMPAVRMADVVADVQNALRALLDGRFRDLGVHPSRLAVAGHSAGGHLAITAPHLAPDVLPAVAGIASLSGLFDLGRIQRSSLNETLALTDGEVERFSPLPKLPTQVSIHAGVGSAETPLFLSENSALAATVGIPEVRYQGLNHYQAVHLLGGANSAPTTFLLEALPRGEQ